MLLTGHEVKVKSLYRPLNFYFISYVYSQSATEVLSLFHNWKISFPNVEKQFSKGGKATFHTWKVETTHSRSLCAALPSTLGGLT